MLTTEEVEAALSSGYELQGFELKGPGSRTDAHLFAKVTRAALSMGNLRDGGHIVIGVQHGDPATMLPGLVDDDLNSWLAYDDVARKLAERADPPLRFDVARRVLSSGANVAVIQVFEFSDTPHLCAKDYQDVPHKRPLLRKGALYVRPRKVPETSEVASLVEMRDIIDLATEKALRAYVETAERAGISLSTSAHEAQTASDNERYERERERGRS